METNGGEMSYNTGRTGRRCYTLGLARINYEYAPNTIAERVIRTIIIKYGYCHQTFEDYY